MTPQRCLKRDCVHFTYLDDEVLLCDEEACVQLLDAVVDDGQRLVQRQALDVLPVHHRQRKRRAVSVRTVWYLCTPNTPDKINPSATMRRLLLYLVNRYVDMYMLPREGH